MSGNVNACQEIIPALTELQRLTIERLTLDEPAKSIAQSLGIRPETISRWKRQPAFRAALEEAREDIHDDLSCRFRQLLDASFGVISKKLESVYYNDERDQLRAALTIIRLSGIADRAMVTKDFSSPLAGEDGLP